MTEFNLYLNLNINSICIELFNSLCTATQLFNYICTGIYLFRMQKQQRSDAAYSCPRDLCAIYNPEL